MYWQQCKAYVQVKPHLFKTARYGNKLKICRPQMFSQYKKRENGFTVKRTELTVGIVLNVASMYRGSMNITD